MFDFLNFFLISFVIAFVAKPWHLTFGATTVILLSSGVGAVIGSFLCGASADRVGRRPFLLATIVLFSLGTAALAFTPHPRSREPAGGGAHHCWRAHGQFQAGRPAQGRHRDRSDREPTTVGARSVVHPPRHRGRRSARRWRTRPAGG